MSARRAHGAARAGAPRGRVDVRIGRPGDGDWARAASALIRRAAKSHDIARRAVPFLRSKIESGRAVLAFHRGELVGFGYFSEWEEGRFVSHSGLVVRDDFRGRGLGRRLKERLMQASRRRFPRAVTMSLTTSPSVLAMNRSLGFRFVPIERLTSDPAFWEGCRTCRNYAEVQARGERCCCRAMLLHPGRPPAARGRRRP